MKLHKTVVGRLAALAAVGVLVFGMLAPLSGCGTPTMTSRERFAQIQRNWGLEWQMMNDDIDHVLLLRPVSGLTYWNTP